MEVPQGLLGDIKNDLDITWADTQTDAKLTGIIKRGMAFLNHKAGAELDYTAEDRPKEILIEYCRAVRNGVLSEFMTSYAPFLNDLRIGNGGAYG